jgi:hypothetical protein
MQARLAGAGGPARPVGCGHAGEFSSPATWPPPHPCPRALPLTPCAWRWPPPPLPRPVPARSVTMDAWNPDQLRKMQAGGNAKLNEFFQQHGIPKATDIKVKYNNRVAEVCVLWCRIVPRRPWPRPYEHACCPSRPAAPCPLPPPPPPPPPPPG